MNNIGEGGYRETPGNSRIGFIDGPIAEQAIEAVTRMNQINSNLDLLIKNVKWEYPELFPEEVGKEDEAMIILPKIIELAETHLGVRAILDQIQGTGEPRIQNERAIEAIQRRLESRAGVEGEKSREKQIVDAIMEYTYIQEAVKRKSIRYLKDYETLNSLCRNIQNDIIPDVNFQEIKLAMASIVSRLEDQAIEG